MERAAFAYLARPCARGRLRRLMALAMLATGALLSLPASAEEPAVLTGTWMGTWWMGKYEEPIELELSQPGKVCRAA